MRRYLRFELKTILIIGLVVRLALASFFAHPFDMNAWYINGEGLLNGKQTLLYFLVPYRYSFFFFVFPETWLFNQLAPHFPNFTIPISSLDPRLNPGSQWGISFVAGLLYNFLLKLPLIASDALVTWFIFQIANRIFPSKHSAALAAAFWFLNPLVIWVSSGWGMFDTLPALFTVLALYFFLEERYSIASLMLVVTAFMKFYGLVLFVPLFFLIWRKAGIRALLRPLAATIISSLVAAIPLFFISNPLSYVTASTPSAAFLYAGLSIWTLFSTMSSGADLYLLSDALVLVTVLFVYYFILMKTKTSDRETLTAVSCFLLPIIALLMFYKFVGENYIVWIIPFSAILAVDASRIRKTHWSISMVALISSITDSLLPYYMLPLSPWIGGFLITVLGLASPARVASNGSPIPGITVGKVFLSTLGVLSFVILLLMLLGTIWRPWKKELGDRKGGKLKGVLAAKIDSELAANYDRSSAA